MYAPSTEMDDVNSLNLSTVPPLGGVAVASSHDPEDSVQ